MSKALKFPLNFNTQDTPASIDLYIPPEVATHNTFESFGLINKSVVTFGELLTFKPVCCQVEPPSVDFIIPIE